MGPDDLLSLSLGDALFKEGRTREAALRFASAHQHAGSEATREKVAQRMNALAEVCVPPVMRLHAVTCGYMLSHAVACCHMLSHAVTCC